MKEREESIKHPPEFAVVFETTDRLLLAMAQGLLIDAGVDYFVSGDEIGLRPGISDAFIHRTYRVVVARESESTARDVLNVMLSGG